MWKFSIRRISKERQEGQGLVEYALILVLVSVVVIGIMGQLGPVIGNVFSSVATAMGVADNAGAPEEPPPDEPKACHPYHFSQYHEVGPSNYIAPGSPVWSRPECSDPVNGSVQVGTSSGPRVYATSHAQAVTECQKHGFSNASRPSIYVIWDCS